MLVDRLEELLALMEDEDDEDEWEDALELRAAAVPAVPAAESGAEEAAESGAEGAAPALEENEGPPAEAGEPDWILDMGSPLPESQEEVPGADGAVDGTAENESAGDGAAEFLRDELAAAVMGPGGSVVLRRPGAGDMELAEAVGLPGWAGAAEMGAVLNAGKPGDEGLEGLYKQAVQAGRPAAPSLPVEQAGRSMRAEEPGRTAALTVDELDRAVRRDSRRYDGGMTIY